MSTVVAEPASWPGAPAHTVQAEPVRAAGLPSNSTVGEPAATIPRCWAGTTNGSLRCSPTCGGRLRPADPCTAAGLPPISTLVARLCVSGAENGSGPGVGCGAPVAGLGIWWIAQLPLILSPSTAAGVPIRDASRPCRVLVELDRLAGDLDRPARLELDAGALQRERAGRLHRAAAAGLDLHVRARLDLDLAAGDDPDRLLGRVEGDAHALVAGDDRHALVGVVVEEDQQVALPGDEAAAPDGPGRAVDQLVAEQGLVDPVVEPAQHVRPAQVALLERDQHLVVDLRQHDRATLGPGARLDGARP